MEPTITIGNTTNLAKLSIDELTALAVRLRLKGTTNEYALQYLIGYTTGRKIVEATTIQTPGKIHRRTRKNGVCT